MVRNLLLKKGFTIGIVILFLGTSVSSLVLADEKTSYSTRINPLIKPSMKLETLDDLPTLNFTLPEAHIYYHLLKVRYPKVEINDTEQIIDVNLSGISADRVCLNFKQMVYLHVKLQLKLTWVVSNTGLKDEANNYVDGYGEAIKLGIFDNWQCEMGLQGIRWNTSVHGIYLLTIRLTGVPPWLGFLVVPHIFLDSIVIYGYPFPSIPLPKIFGKEVKYQVNIHV